NNILARPNNTENIGPLISEIYFLFKALAFLGTFIPHFGINTPWKHVLSNCQVLAISA
ncbi:hypothetical protein ACJX0J_040770, partial [Zea mays]